VTAGSSAALTSTAMRCPGWATEAPAGVPVRMTSPGSSVMNRDRSATISPMVKSIPAEVSSWTSSPSSQVRTRSPSCRTWEAGMRAGPTGVKPSPLLERTFEPLSA